MLTAKEARGLAENYAWSKKHFLDDTFEIIEKYSKTGSLSVIIREHCKHHEGFDISTLVDLRVLGYVVHYDEVEGSLSIEW